MFDAERLAAELDRNDLALARGEHAALLGELTERVAAHPQNERLAGQPAPIDWATIIQSGAAVVLYRQ